MTVKELIDELEKLDPNAKVFRHGYEGGFGEINTITTDVDMVLNVYDSKYFGKHERVNDLDKEELEGKTIVKGVVI